MDSFGQFFFTLLSPLLYPVLSGQRIYALFLGGALALAFVVYVTAHRRRGEGPLRGFLRYCFPKSIYAHPSATLDYRYFFFVEAGFTLFLAPLLFGAVIIAGWTGAALSAVFGPASAGIDNGPVVTVLYTFVMALALDFGIFFAHYLQHKIPVLWEFHKVHHSAEVLTPMTVYRMHPVDKLGSGWMVGVCAGVAHGVMSYLFPSGLSEIAVGPINVVLFAFYLAGYNLRHSHIWLPYPASLSHILISPAQHQIHHSCEPRHIDRNFGFIFAFWDYFFGSLYLPRGREELSLGLSGGEQREYDTVWRLFALPVKKALALVGERRRALT